MKIYISMFSLIGALSLLSAACQKELVYEERAEDPYRMEIKVDWELEWEMNSGNNWLESWESVGSANDYDFFRPRQPEGMAVILYDGIDGDYTFSREMHLPSSGGSFSIDPTTRAILFINDDSDYVVIKNLGSPYTVTASTGNHMSALYSDLHPGEKSLKQPDLLYGALVELTDEQIEKGKLPEKVVISPLVYGYVIKYNITKNLEYVAGASGALAGMAGSVNIKDGSTDDSKARYLFDCELTPTGLEVLVMTFGVPSMEGGTQARVDTGYQGRHDLRLTLKLANGKTLTVDHDVTDQLSRQPKGGVIAIYDLEIPDELVKGSSGFQPDVDEWGDEKDIPLPLPK